ncbi:MAG: hypothetical protein M5U26_02720 [Planctomycetota bacterium]|nr:hypothetical protein [Planctomycetota bacterium]
MRKLGVCLGLWIAAGLLGSCWSPAAHAGDDGESKPKKEKKEKDKDKEKEAKKDEGFQGAPAAPSMTQKAGEPIHDRIVEFEAAYAELAPLCAVAPDAKHDYDACAKAAKKVEESSRAILTLHEDRLRQFGNDYHHKLELLAINAHRLRVAVAEHQRDNIFHYWGQLKLIRDGLAQTHPWQTPYRAELDRKP